MKKFIFFLIITLSITFLKTMNVYANTVNFYEGEYIDGIYMNKRASGSNTIYYQKARFFRQSGTNEFAYCIEPFSFFNSSEAYESNINPYNLTDYQKERISKIAHFGYGYTNHYDTKWYAITQFMIWKEADPTGDFYFTDTLNGKRIVKYQEEINEINSLINNYDLAPSIINKKYNIVEGEKINLLDVNNVLNNYQVDNSNFYINSNTLISDSLKKGSYEINLTRENNIYNKPIIFFQTNNSQNLVETGNIDSKNFKLRINVINTEIELTKIDSKTKTTSPSGDAQLNGAIYQLYDQNMNEVEKITIDNDCKGTLKNIKFGKYYLKEIKAGLGYTLDNKMYEFEITKENNSVNLILENKVIEAKIEINKVYENEKIQAESNITFDIYDKNNNLIKSITTNEFGHAEIYLPYGKYKIKQKNSTEGYYKVEDFYIDIKNNETQVYNLTDYKIKVPNTKTNIILTIIRMVLLICIKSLF